MNIQKPLDEFQQVRIKPAPDIKRGQHRPVRWGRWLVLAIILAYFFFPFRTNILLLGTDDSPERGELGRTDTIILNTITPYYTGMLGIPRDLWVTVPGVGEQRINTAYFFAEAAEDGSGADAAMDTVRQNFGVTVNHFVLIHMDGLVGVVDALGGVDITLEKPQGGLEAGTHHLDAGQTLAFIRERYSADDFSRMAQGQMVLVASIKKMVIPTNWGRIPRVVAAVSNAIDTDIPVWLYPRLGLSLARAALFGIDGRTINREMVFSYTTDLGANVLLPDWSKINPVLLEMFRE